MAIFKRTPDGPWWVQFRIGGRDIFRSARTKERRAAEEFEQALRNRYWRHTQLGEEVHTWGEAVQRLKREARWSKNTREANERAFSRFAAINHVPLADIGRQTVAEAPSMLLDDGLAPATVNRHMAVLGQVLRSVVNWGWLKTAPPISLERVPERDTVWLTPEQCEALVLELPEHLRGPFLFSILTGIRMSNTRDLTWDQVNLDQGFVTIPSSSYKARKNITVPLEAAALVLLRSIGRSEGTDRVFTYRPYLKGGNGERAPAQPITRKLGARAWRKATKRAGVRVRWHDLRHTFASWLAAAGASDQILTSLMGWTTPAIAKRYAHLRLADTRSWASLAGANAVAAVTAVREGIAVKLQKTQEDIVVPTHRIELWTPSLRMMCSTN
jgi:integrase